MIDILFIRHGATEGNLHRRYIGRTDEPLCAAGIAQAERLRGQNLFADCLFVSPLLRARQTAEIVFPHVTSAAVISALPPLRAHGRTDRTACVVPI